MKLQSFLIGLLVPAALVLSPSIIGSEKVLAQAAPTLSTEDQSYLTDFHESLETPAAKQYAKTIAESEIVSQGQTFCKSLDDGSSIADYLGAISEASADYPKETQNAVWDYYTSIVIVGIQHYCPQYTSDLQKFVAEMERLSQQRSGS